MLSYDEPVYAQCPYCHRPIEFDPDFFCHGEGVYKTYCDKEYGGCGNDVCFEIEISLRFTFYEMKALETDAEKKAGAEKTEKQASAKKYTKSKADSSKPAGSKKTGTKTAKKSKSTKKVETEKQTPGEETEKEQIIRMFKEGNTKGRICWALWGYRNSDRYKQIDLVLKENGLI